MISLIKQENLVHLNGASTLDGIPELPGVYAFRDDQGTTIYVGKAKSLRRRVSSYLRQLNPYLEDRIRRMVHQARQLHIFETESELLALLLEDQLIKEHCPEFNIRLKDAFRHRYLAFTDEDYPTLRIVDGPAAHHPELFGPYQDRYAAEAVHELVCKWFALRTCSAPMPARTCAYYDMRLCPGPCQALVSRGQYAEHVRSAAAFLMGDESSLLHRMLDSLEQHSRQLRFEQAAEIKRTMEFCHRLVQRQRFFRCFTDGQLVLHERREGEATYRFHQGWLVDYRPEIVPWQNLPVAEVGERFPRDTEQGTDERYLVDRANIVYSWINRHQCEHVFLPGS
ncbi:MAG: GIY-YIG nuclease family protein [Fidelibacterota bacterium]|nr:MAG: GIY-YIG nuclease family protein [Candidatus Neomarinimicrobiota bacterium]